MDKPSLVTRRMPWLPLTLAVLMSGPFLAACDQEPETTPPPPPPVTTPPPAPTPAPTPPAAPTPAPK